VILLVLLLLTRTYHVVAIRDLPTSLRTHVAITGRVTSVRHEADGDWHIWVSDGRVKIVVEIIPLIPVPVPRVGACVQVRGIRRIDAERGHAHRVEIHPAEQLLVMPCP